MNRDALLVYLRDLRDLELAKLSLPATHAQGAAALLQDAYALNLIPSSYHHLAGHHGGRPAPEMFGGRHPAGIGKAVPGHQPASSHPAPHPTARGCQSHPLMPYRPRAGRPSPEGTGAVRSDPRPAPACQRFLRQIGLKKTTFPQRWSFFMPRKISKTPPPLARSCPRWCVPRRTTPA